jgi:hypothetical protein
VTIKYKFITGSQNKRHTLHNFFNGLGSHPYGRIFKNYRVYPQWLVFGNGDQCEGDHTDPHWAHPNGYAQETGLARRKWSLCLPK